jgi:hypothetical protein
MTQDMPAYVDAAASLLGLPIAPGHRDAVIEAMAMIWAQADLVLAFDLAHTIEAAPRFRPC